MLEYIEIQGTTLISTRIALGTWAIGGWMWGGTDEAESIRTIPAALDQGINVIDTAPIYGYGTARILSFLSRKQPRQFASSTNKERFVPSVSAIIPQNSGDF